MPPSTLLHEPPSALLDEPHVALRRTIEERAANRPRIEKKKQPRPWWISLKLPKWRASRVVPTALVALTLLAVLQTAYILRTLPWQSADGAVTNSETDAPPIEAQPAPIGPARPDGRADLSAGTSGTGSRPAVKSRLLIRSEPSGARVSIDGRYRGVTPLTLADVKPGNYRVSLEREGSEVRQTVRVEPGAVVSLVAPMSGGASAPGWLSLQSPIALDVFEDGSLLGTTRSSRILLQAGQHTLQLVNEQLNFRETRQVQVEAGSVVRIPVNIPEAIVQLNATPWAEVWVDGKHVGQTPIGRLSLGIGTHEFVFRHPELGEKKATAVVKIGVPTRVTADLRRQPPSTSH